MAENRIVLEQFRFPKNAESKILAFAHIILYGKIKIFNARLLKNSQGEYYVGMPSQKGTDGKWYDYVKIMDEKIQTEVLSAFLAEYQTRSKPAAPAQVERQPGDEEFGF